MKKQSKDNKIPSLMFIIITLVINFAAFFYLKYLNQNLFVKNFDYRFFGNIINVVIFAALFLLCIIFVFTPYYYKKKKIVYFHLFSMTLLLPLIFFSKLYVFDFTDLILYDHPIDEVIHTFFFTAYLFLVMNLLVTICLFFINTKRFLFFKSVFVVALLVLSLFIYSSYKVYTNKDVDYKKVTLLNKNNIGIILGAAVWTNRPSPAFVSRIEKCLELYNEQYINKVQVTGSNSPGEPSEAEIALKYIRGKNIKQEDILYESNTTSTNEQIQFIHKNLVNKYDNLFVVSDLYHLTRVREICHFYRLKVIYAGTNTAKKDINFYYLLREGFGLTLFWLFAI